jgi:CRISPR/Cas system endoribonuclease Cas6 (RAMP superfamily)
MHSLLYDHIHRHNGSLVAVQGPRRPTPYTFIIFMQKAESRVQNVYWCALWKISSGAENLVL